MSLRACKVAALVGKHPFQPRERALLDALKENRRPLWNELVAERPELSFNYQNAQVPELAPLIESAAPATRDAVRRIAASLAREPRFEGLAQEGRLEQAVAEMVTIQRGVAQEETILQRVAEHHGPVERQQEPVRLNGPGFVVVGNIDGMTPEGVIVEAKSRTTKIWPRPPSYDMIQLQVYLRALNCSTGLLAERVQDGSDYRETSIKARLPPHIIPGLSRAANKIRAATLDTARRWAMER